MHLELVEAEQRGLGGDAVGQRRDRVLGVAMLLLPGMDALVRLLHELVEVDPLLPRHIGAGEEQVHQHGLAAADLANQIESLGRVARGFLDRLAAQEAGDEAAALLGGRLVLRLVAARAAPEILQGLGGKRLGGVGTQFTRRHLRTVGGEWSFGVGREASGLPRLHGAIHRVAA